MQIKLDRGKSFTIITKDPTDPRFKTESALWYAIRNELKIMGIDAIKKLMWKDGHMICETQHYVRTRTMDKMNDFMLHYGNYMIELMNDDFNKNGKITLECHWSY
jgi:hypothetical protein